MPDKTLLERVFEFQGSQMTTWIFEKLNKERLEELLKEKYIDQEDYIRICVAIKKGITKGIEKYVEKKERKGRPLYPLCAEDRDGALQCLFYIVFDTSIPECLVQELVPFGHDGKVLGDFVDLVGKEYGLFAYAQFGEFKEKFIADVSKAKPNEVYPELQQPSEQP